MKKYTTWVRGTLALMLALLLAAGGAVAGIDPFFHYHARLPGLSYPFNLEYYQNPGIVQNFEYDSLLTGSSVTTEFKPSLFAELMGQDMVKVSHSDASPLMLRQTLQLALAANDALKTVYYGLDHWALPRNPERLSTAMPEYLYDQNPFNDTAYVLNKDVLLDNTLGVLWNTATDGGYDDFDTAYTQDYNFICGESIALAQYQTVEVPQSEQVAAGYDAALMLENTRRNLEENVLPLVTSRPDTTFVFFFTPGSILYWYDVITYKNLDDAFDQLALAAGLLLQQPNVALYSFMDAEEIVCNLYNYFDWIHYGPWVHAFMTRCFADGSYRLTAENYDARMADLRAMVEGYDYAALFGSEAAPFKAAADAVEYTGALADERYITLIAVQGELPPETSPALAHAYAQLRLSGPEPGAESYVAAAGQDNLLPLEQSAMPGALGVTMAGQIGELDCAIKSGVEASVVINGVEYAQRLPGVNLVVWDTETGRVVDSVAFGFDGGAPQRRTSPRP